MPLYPDSQNRINTLYASVSGKLKAEIQAARKSDETDDPIDVLVYDPIAIHLTHFFIKIHCSANAVTLLSLLFGICGSILLYPKDLLLNLAGIACEIFAAILDCCDGQVARLTHSESRFGRILDGAVDMINYLAIYIALGFRMMDEPVPFTSPGSVFWSWRIWIVIALAIFLHAGQARMADYYRGLHLYFLKGRSEDYHSRAKDLRAEIAVLPAGTSFFHRLCLKAYLLYTLAQEKSTPHSQQLLTLAESGKAREGLAAAYLDYSRKIIQVTNVLSYNLRTYTLFLFLLFKREGYFFLFVFVILEGIKLLMTARYEAIAARLCAEYAPASSSQAESKAERRDR